MEKSVYLDYNATTPVAPEVLEEMLPHLREEFGNPSSIHSFGQRAKAALYDARERVAALIGAKPSEVLFTSGGTESDNLAILGVLEAAEGKRRHLVASAVEHHAVLNTIKAFAKKGVRVSWVRPNRHGQIEPEDLERALTPETLLVSIMHANNETGVVQPIAELARRAHRAGAYFHTDAVQSVGKIRVDVGELGVDLLSLSGHKMYGPKGTGALYVGRRVDLRRVLHGGGQERSRRAGTENLAGLVGLGRAAELARHQQPAEAERLADLRDRLEEGVVRSVDGVHVNGAGVERTPNTVSFRFEELEGETLTIALDLQGYAVSTGAACSSGTVEPSHVLMAMGLDDDEVKGSIRVSLGKYTTGSEIEGFISVLRSVVSSMRRHTGKRPVRV